MVASATAASAKYTPVINLRMQTAELTPLEKNPSLEANILSVKNLRAHYDTPKFITMVTITRHGPTSESSSLFLILFL